MKYKYPRTHHFSWSESNTSDDVWLEDSSQFSGHEVIVSEKMDGENFSLGHDYLHARSVDSKDHASRHWIKNLHNTIKHDIQGYRICGENLYAKHSIFYANLTTYFYVFGIYNEDNVCLSWDETTEFCELLKLEHVPIIYRGVWDEKLVYSLWTGKSKFETFTDETCVTSCNGEGYVVRLAESFVYEKHKVSTGKFVRKNHVTTSQHWMYDKIIPNGLVNAKS